MLTAEEVLKVAKLANLRIGEQEMAKTAKDLSAILGHIEQLGKLDTADVPPTSHVIGVENVFREDAVTARFDPAKSLANAPAQSKNYFSVPRIIE